MPTRPGYIWSGTEWVSIGQEAVVAPVSYQTSAPSTPSTGDIWIDSNDDVPGIDTSQFLRWRKTAVGGETSVSGTDDNGLTLQYTANYEQVYLNGVLLVRGQDYTATNGTSITGLTALAANDVVEVFGVVARVVGDVYTQAQADAKYSLQTTTGLVLITTATMSSATALQVNNCFTSSYDNYLITYRFNTSVNDGVYLKFSNNGTPTSGGTDYSYSRIYWTNNGNGLANGGSNGTSSIVFASLSTTLPSSGSWNLYNPASALPTAMSGVSSYANLGEAAYGRHSLSTAYDGFNLTSSSSISGTIKVYGYK